MSRPARRPATYEDRRSCPVEAAPDDLWRVVAGLGGSRGWPGTSLAWALRGGLDRLVGGPGQRPERADPDHLRTGDVVDSWQVEHVEEGRHLQLRSRMRLPGTARLELAVVDGPDGRARLVQRASFSPDGLAGHLYWWSAQPLHHLVFARLLTGIARAAERGSA